jgi:PQQ-dependent catabolism-associated CXXCW motif protein
MRLLIRTFAVLLLTLGALARTAAPAFAQVSPTGNYAMELQDFGIAPQQALHTGAPHAPTPLNVPGATTITTADLYSRLAAKQPLVLLYVNGEGGDNSLSIAGSHWLAGAGLGQSFSDTTQARLIKKLDQLASGNRNALVVAFCYDAHCWLSYNVALRLVNAGYHNVLWYRGGREAWKAAGLSLTALTQDAW